LQPSFGFVAVVVTGFVVVITDVVVTGGIVVVIMDVLVTGGRVTGGAVTTTVPPEMYAVDVTVDVTAGKVIAGAVTVAVVVSG